MEEAINDPANCRLGKDPDRWVWATQIGKVPFGHVVVRACRTEGCINPAHLRLKKPPAEWKGSRHPPAPPVKLTDAQVASLRAEFPRRGRESTRAWFVRKGAELGVGHATIRRAVYGFGYPKHRNKRAS